NPRPPAAGNSAERELLLSNLYSTGYRRGRMGPSALTAKRTATPQGGATYREVSPDGRAAKRNSGTRVHRRAQELGTVGTRRPTRRLEADQARAPGGCRTAGH